MANRISQQQLRQLMKERAQSKKDTRIDSPLAKYDANNNLWCIVCNQMISSDLIWSTHLIGKLHKKKVKELKNQSETLSTNRNERNSMKRVLNNNDDVDVVPNKFLKANIDKPLITKKEEKIIKTELNDSVPSSSLPGDFFETEMKLAESNGENTEINDKLPATLPKGFFDDPMLDAKARNANNESLDAQMELFRKEIAEESIVSQNIIEEETEVLEKEKMLNEINEQIEKWSKVNQFQERIEAIHKNKSARNKTEPVRTNESDSDSDNMDSEDFNMAMNSLSWRKKDVFS